MKAPVSHVRWSATILLAIAWTNTAAHAACEGFAAAFDRAVAAKSIDGARHAAADIADDIVCGARGDEYQARLVSFLVALADAGTTSAADRARAIDIAQGSLDISGNWRTATALADYFMRRGDKVNALTWYEKGVSFLISRPGVGATPAERQQLLMKTAAAKSLANDDQEGQKTIAWVKTRGEMDGKLGGVYSPGLLRGVGIVAVPLPINFFTDETRFTPTGQQALAELVQAVQEQHVRTMKLIGHADPRGSNQHNMDLSRRRVEAVRNELGRAGVAGQITIEWKGSQQPFDTGVLPYKPSQQEIWALDRRVEWAREGTSE